MKVICTKEVGAFDIKMTQNDHDQYWRFEWLQSCPSTRNLPEEIKTQNQQRWIFSSAACVSVVVDTELPVLALAVFEKGGKLNNVTTVHVISHFDPMAAEYAVRARHWAGIISNYVARNKFVAPRSRTAKDFDRNLDVLIEMNKESLQNDLSCNIH